MNEWTKKMRMALPSKKLGRMAGLFFVVITASTVMSVSLTGMSLIAALRLNAASALVIGLVIITLLQVSGSLKRERTSRAMPRFIAVVVLGGWIGALAMVPVYRFVFRLPFSAGHAENLFFAVTFFAIFYGATVYTYEALRRRIERTAAELAEKNIREQNLLRLKTKAELEALRSKVDPHFLFNTLNSIASLIPVDPARAEDMVLRLSGLLRAMLSAGSRDMVRLSEELEMIGQYLEIERVRLGSRLRYRIDMDENLESMMIPGLLLQPLVENSVKHGIAPKEDGGEIRITCRKADSCCTIEIADSGAGIACQPVREGFGLYGVRERLELHYPGRYGFRITGGNGVDVRITLPFREAEEGEA